MILQYLLSLPSRLREYSSGESWTRYRTDKLLRSPVFPAGTEAFPSASKGLEECAWGWKRESGE